MQIPTPLTVFAPWAYEINAYTVNVTASGIPICKPDRRRVYINISTISGVPITLSSIGFGTNVQQGGRQSWDQNGNYQLTWNTHYTLVQESLYLISSAYPALLGVTEVILAQPTITRSNDAKSTIRSIEREIKAANSRGICTGSDNRSSRKSQKSGFRHLK